MNGFAQSTYGGWTRGQVAGQPVGEYLWDRANITNPALSMAARKQLRAQAKQELAAIRADADLRKELLRMTSKRRTFPRYAGLSASKRYERFARFDNESVPYAPENAWGAYTGTYPYMTTAPYKGRKFVRPANPETLIGQYARLMAELRRRSATTLPASMFTSQTAAQLRANGIVGLPAQIAALRSMIGGDIVPGTPGIPGTPVVASPRARRQRIAVPVAVPQDIVIDEAMQI